MAVLCAQDLQTRLVQLVRVLAAAGMRNITTPHHNTHLLLDFDLLVLALVLGVDFDLLVLHQALLLNVELLLRLPSSARNQFIIIIITIIIIRE